MPEKHNRNVHKLKLPNGLTLLTESMPHVRSIALGIWLNTGSRQESMERGGITHFIEHMVFKGTRRRTAEQIARSMDSIGGHLDAFTAKECVSFSAVVLDQHFTQALDVLSDLVLNPLFDPSDIKKEQGVVLEEIKAEEDNPEYLLHELFAQKFWKNHPLGRPILGTRQTVAAFNRSSVQEQFEKAYHPSNMVIAIAGHLEHRRVTDQIRRRFDDLKPQNHRAVQRRPVIHANITLKNRESLEQAHLCLGVPSYPLAHERRYACYVLNTLLGGGMSSRLFQKIRERQGLVYSVFSELTPYRDTGGLLVCAGTSPASVPKVIASIIEEFRDLKEHPVAAEDLQRSKDQLKGSIMLGLESTASRMSNLARQEMYFGRYVSLDEMIQKIDAVTAEDLTAIAREFFRTDQIALTVLGRLNGMKIPRKMLAC
ncbi:MAG: insulinase family protein [Acidobacteria bacterium]|nr:insulinase family protein [Acidobacteriota bacterium]